MIIFQGGSRKRSLPAFALPNGRFCFYDERVYPEASSPVRDIHSGYHVYCVHPYFYEHSEGEHLFEDSVYRKLGGKPDEKTEYVYNTWKKLGYLDYVRLNDYCLELYEAGSEEIQKAVEPDSPEAAQFVELYQSKGYNIGYFTVSKRPFAYRDVPIFQRLWNWFSNLVQIDHVNRVQDPNNPDLERKIYLPDAHGRTGPDRQRYIPQIPAVYRF